MKVPVRYYFLFALVILFLSHQTFPQKHITDKIQFEHLTKENGLSDNFIMSILKDSKGFIWIGTLDGLNRYDGKVFKVYRYSIGDPNSLGANEIHA